MDITVEAIEALRVPDGFTPVVGFRRFGIPWPPRGPEHYLVQKGHRWMPQEQTVAECRRTGSSDHVRARRRKQPLAKTRLLSLGTIRQERAKLKLLELRLPDRECAYTPWRVTSIH